MYDQIRPMSFRFTPGASNLQHNHREMAFPPSWKGLLTQLQADISKRPVARTSLPISDLNRALLALVPDLIHVHKYADAPRAQQWLASSRDVNPEAIRLIVLAWARASFKGAAESSLEDVLAELAQQSLVWHAETVDLTEWDINESGTARPGHAGQFDLLPDYLATRLSQPHVSFRLGHEVLRFRRAPLAPGSTGAELISWPPLVHLYREKEHYYSYVISVTVQTVPLVPYPLIYFDFGIRRWVSGSTRPRRTHASVYLLTSVPWLSTLHQANSFQIARTKWKREGAAFTMGWTDHLVDILDSLSSQQSFPEARELFHDPVGGLNLGGSPNAAVAFSEGMKPRHPTRPGLMPADRRELLEQIVASLEPDFELTATLPRVGSKKPAAQINPFRQATNGAVVNERVQLLSQAVGERVRFEVLYDRRSTLQSFLSRIGDMFDVQVKSDEAPFRFVTGDLEVIVDWRIVGSIGDALTVDGGIRNRRDRRQRAADNRVTLIRAVLDNVHEPTVSFVELAGEDAFDEGADPKQAIRIGLAYTGRLSQFIDKTSKAPHQHRVERAVLDGLRQLGLYREPDLLVEGIGRVDHMGVWLVAPKRGTEKWTQNEYLPVFVYLDSEESRIYATAPGLDGWRPYHETLLALGQRKSKGFESQEHALNFIDGWLRTEIDPEASTILLCHSQNLRRTWKWLQDGQLRPDEPSFGPGREWPIDDWPGLRIVRVRSNQSGETPEWYAIGEDEYGHSKGLFRINDRVYASTYGKPQQFKHVSKQASKVENPGAQAWNPGMYELVVAAAQAGDNFVELAMSAHVSRDAHIQYDDATALPLVLHLAQLAEEYVHTAYEEEDEADEE